MYEHLACWFHKRRFSALAMVRGLGAKVTRIEVRQILTMTTLNYDTFETALGMLSYSRTTVIWPSIPPIMQLHVGKSGSIMTAYELAK